MWGTQLTFPWGFPPSHLPDPPPPPSRRVGGWPQLISWEGWLPEWGRAENPPSSCLKSLASPLLGVGLKTLLPNLGGVAPVTAQLL
uniref:Uncharacterized protein n=1 Tax=Saimiri boliviensis boliviensis TaxID=39432 RepID=A0A2K6UTE8_SAIBB